MIRGASLCCRRRHFIRTEVAIHVCFSSKVPTASAGFGALMLETPADRGIRMPAEWVRHECCWMAWPSRDDQWVDGLAGAQRAYAAIARAIRRFEPVRMVAGPHCAQDAHAQCGADIEIIPVPIDDPWMRDSGPTFLAGADGRRAGTAWRFNAWGGKCPSTRTMPDWPDEC